jgi:hypothetical protein
LLYSLRMNAVNVRLLLPLVLAASAASAADRVVLLIEDRSGSAVASKDLTPLFRAALARRGYEVKADLEPLRGRHIEELKPEESQLLLAEAQAKLVVAVTIRFALPPQARARGPEAGAALGLTATAFSAERVAWRGSFGSVANPGGKEKPLPKQAASRLFWSFPLAPGATLASAIEPEEIENGSAERVQLPADYDAPIERLRSSRKGPRFPLRLRKKER